VLMLAGGTGLAPFLSMLGKVAETGSDHPIHLVYGVTNDGDLVEVETIAEYVKKIPSFTFATCVADKGSNHPLKGYVTHHLEAKHLNAGDVDVYLCGPPPMVEAVRVFFRDQGVNPVNFHYEKFAPSEGGAS
jgi:benzoate/toluate 1,2-dioxygenase reductase subunit